MKYGKQNTLEKLNIIAQTLPILRGLRVFFFVYAFLSFLFWFLNCFEVDWLYIFNWLFLIPYKILSIFYKADGVSADFSLAIIGALSLILGFATDYSINILFQKLVELEEEEERRQRNIHARTTKKAVARPKAFLDINDDTSTEMPMVPEECNLIFIISPHINKIKKAKDDADLSFQDLELWKQRVNKKIIETTGFSKPIQKGYYRKNLFFVYQDFGYVDDFIYYLKPTLDSLSLDFRRYGISVSFSYVLSAISKMNNLEKELDCMDTILALNFINDFIVTERFKNAYERMRKPVYTIKEKGEYNLSKNLQISNRQYLYILTERENSSK